MQMDLIDFEIIKEYVEERLKDAELFANTRKEVMNYRAMAFGAILFCQKENFCSYEDIKEYWEDYAWQKFEDIAREKGKGPKVEVI